LDAFVDVHPWLHHKLSTNLWTRRRDHNLIVMHLYPTLGIPLQNVKKFSIDLKILAKSNCFLVFVEMLLVRSDISGALEIHDH
jgi:hypothetical protein